jgi:hypothetical protein
MAEDPFDENVMTTSESAIDTVELPATMQQRNDGVMQLQ